MPPHSTAHTYGDLSLAPATNPDRHGYGKFSLPSNIELNAAASGSQVIKTLAADLTLQSAKNTYVKALLGNVEVVSQQNYLLGAVNSTSTLLGKHTVTAATSPPPPRTHPPRVGTTASPPCRDHAGS